MREFLDRLLNRSEGELCARLRLLARNVGEDSALPNNLRHGLAIMCQRLGVQGACVALKQPGGYVVAAPLNSRPVGKLVEGADCDDVAPPGPDLAGEVDWLAPVFVGGEQVAVIGLGPTRTTHRQQLDAHERLASLAAEAQTREAGLQARDDELLAALGQEPPPDFVRLVEEALRQVTDYAALGQSPLAAQLQAPGTTHVERGKALRERLIQALEALRPAAKRPAEPLPREWQGYVVLYDAYLEDMPNREIMARLYVSQGTFNRVRRKALRSVARNLLEMTSAAAPAG